jgi:hypothetical protein
MPWLRLAILVVPMLGGCRLVDQTTFDPALRARVFAPPKPAPVAAAAPSGPPPLLTIRFDQPVSYADQLRVAVGDAVRRKPDVEFNVVTVVPDAGGVDAQIAAVQRYGGDARRVAADIQADGVDPGQIGLGARAEPGASGHEVRVYVR